MKIIHTSEGPAVLNDSDEVVMPSDFDGIVDLAKTHSAIVTELMLALAKDVAAMLPVGEGLKVPSAVDPSSMHTFNVGVRAADSMRRVAEAVSQAAQPDPEEEQ